MRPDGPGDLGAYVGMTAEELSRVVLCLLVEEMLRGRLAAFRQDLAPEPVEGLEELGVVRGDVVPVGHPLR